MERLYDLFSGHVAIELLKDIKRERKPVFHEHALSLCRRGAEVTPNNSAFELMHVQAAHGVHSVDLRVNQNNLEKDVDTLSEGSESEFEILEDVQEEQMYQQVIKEAHEGYTARSRTPF